jgi:hypothetical protein
MVASSVFCVREDRLDDAVEIPVHVVIPKAKRQEAERGEMRVSSRVMREAGVEAMLAAVDLHNQPMFEADQIQDVAFQWRLSPEVKTLELELTQLHP